MALQGNFLSPVPFRGHRPSENSVSFFMNDSYYKGIQSPEMTKQTCGQTTLIKQKAMAGRFAR